MVKSCSGKVVVADCLSCCNFACSEVGLHFGPSLVAAMVFASRVLNSMASYAYKILPLSVASRERCKRLF